MEIYVTADQVTKMAPDASAATAAKKLASSKHWQSLGQQPGVLWGECQGSALYQVRVALDKPTFHCSCPSRKQPCKHGLGLLLLAANTPDAIPQSEAPEWVASWLARRAAAEQREEHKESQKESQKAPAKGSGKSAEKRQAKVDRGIEQLDLWLNDLVRNGLGKLETTSTKFWEQQAAQMVDAQAPGIATRIRRMASIPNASNDWPEKLLAQLGQLSLLTQAYRRLERLDSALQADIRQSIGWNYKEDEVIAQGKHVTDDWLFLGQVVEEGERGRSQRTWLLGASGKRPAMLLQFAIAQSSFPQVYLTGIRQQAELTYWPGIQPQRALITGSRGEATSIQERLPGKETIEEFCAVVAATLALQPWQERFLCTLRAVIPTHDKASGRWSICDRNDQALPLANGEYWSLLALSGGRPVDFAGEWNGETLLPLGILVDTTYHVL